MDIHDWVKAHTEFSEFDIYDVVGIITDYINDCWRDAVKELPVKDGVYLVYDAEGSMGLSHYRQAAANAFEGWYDVIAWRELPEPPVFPVQKSNLLFMPTVASSQGE